MMKFIEELIDLPVKHKYGNKIQRIFDVLFNVDTSFLEYIVIEQKIESEHSKEILKLENSCQLLYIPISHVVFNDKEILYDGDLQSDDMILGNHLISLRSKLDTLIETDDGETVGKIHDILIDIPLKQVMIVQLNKSFWKNFSEGGSNYVATAYIRQWNANPLIIDSGRQQFLFDNNTR